MRSISLIFFMCLLLGISLFGCAKQMSPVLTQTGTPERFYVKNYTIGIEQLSNVGDSIIKVKDYMLVEKTTAALKPTNDFTIGYDGGDVMLSGQKGEPINIVGMVTVENDTFYLLQSLHQQILIPISKNGQYYGGNAVSSNRFVVGGDVMVNAEGSWVVKPYETKFYMSKKQDIDTSSGFINFEILYTGMTRDAINFLYREYTSTDLARPAFYQNLTYPIDAEFIRFKSIKISIANINEECIRYTVIDD